MEKPDASLHSKPNTLIGPEATFSVALYEIKTVLVKFATH